MSEQEDLEKGKAKAARVSNFITHMANALQEVVVGSAELGAFNPKQPKPMEEKKDAEAKQPSA